MNALVRTIADSKRESRVFLPPGVQLRSIDGISTGSPSPGPPDTNHHPHSGWTIHRRPRAMSLS